MVDQTQRRRDSDEATAVDSHDNATLSSPMQTPAKGKEMTEKSHDKEAQAAVKEGSIGESTIKVKQLSWFEAAGLMFTEYIVIAILSFPSSYSALGMAGGVIATVLIGLLVLYTSHILWRFCMLHPNSPDIVDLSTRLFPEKWRKPAYIVVSGMFLLNNLFIMGLHTLSGSVALNTLSDHSMCTVIWSVIITIIMFSMSLFRELNQVAILGFISAGTMFVALLLCLIFLGIEGHPAGWTEGASVTVRVWALPDTTFVTGFNAVLNIVYTFVGHALVPTYIADMKRPEDFPKALYLCTFLEIVLFVIGGAVGYHYIGDEYIVSPAYGALREPYTKIVAAWTLPTILVVGILYSQVTSRFIFLRFFDSDSVHRLQHTVKGWATWVGIVAVGYIIAWIIGSAIPFFNDLLALMSSLFDWWFGFVLEGLAFFQIYKGGRLWQTPARKAEAIANIFVVVAGIFVLVGGAYSSISAINQSYADGLVGSPFSCENNGF